MLQRANWLQLGRFAAVGATGYVINLLTFALAFRGAGFDYRVAAVLAFLVAVQSNFLFNRRWTFSHVASRRHVQATRFFVVSTAAFACNVALLELLVTVASVPHIPAQAMAVAAATPVSFAGNKLWTFA